MDKTDKVIFLDVDGVLNNMKTKAVTPSNYVGVMDSKVKLLRKIVDATGAAVVLSSDWRLCDKATDPDFHYLVNKLKYKGNITLYGYTPNLNIFRRGMEINAWLAEHEYVKEYVVLDDVDFSDYYRPEFFKHVVITDYYEGLMESDVEKAIKILNGEFEV